MNKFGQRLGPRVQTHIDGVAIADLSRATARRCSSSPNARSSTLPRARARRSRGAIRGSARLVVQDQLPRGDLPVFHREGAFAEVVSPVRVGQGRHAGRSARADPLQRAVQAERRARARDRRRFDPARRQPRRDRADRAHRPGGRAPRARRDPREHVDRRRPVVESVRAEPRIRPGARGDHAGAGRPGDGSRSACIRTSARSCTTRRPTARRREDRQPRQRAARAPRHRACRSSISAAVSLRRTR